jgi:hypothetical protein
LLQKLNFYRQNFAHESNLKVDVSVCVCVSPAEKAQTIFIDKKSPKKKIVHFLIESLI